MDRRAKKGERLAMAVAAICLLSTSGCGKTTDTPLASVAPSANETVHPNPDGEEKGREQSEQSSDTKKSFHSPYLEELIEETIARITTPNMSEYEKAKAAFDYMIEHTVLDEPIGTELWQIYDGGQEPLPFVEQRALSPLRFGVGMCEDYAAALTMLLRGMGIDAEYVPGLTYSVEGHLVDHAWTTAKIDGMWYHLDCQLEDNISRHGAIRYRYFMKSDGSMSGSHRWGQNLIDSGLLTPEQSEEVTTHFLYKPCPQDYPSPEQYTLNDMPAPDISLLREEAAAELSAYESENGALPPMVLNTTPPVFGMDGFGPPDEG